MITGSYHIIIDIKQTDDWHLGHQKDKIKYIVVLYNCII